MAQRNCSMRLFCEPTRKFFAVKRKGFTLVELVIVIAVLAIIAAIAIPTVNGVVKNANKATDDSNIQAIAATIKTFAAEYEAKSTHPFPPGSEKEKLDDSSTLEELFSVYGVTLPTPKENPGYHFFWYAPDQSVHILKDHPTADADGGGGGAGWVWILPETTIGALYLSGGLSPNPDAH